MHEKRVVHVPEPEWLHELHPSEQAHVHEHDEAAVALVVDARSALGVTYYQCPYCQELRTVVGGRSKVVASWLMGCTQRKCLRPTAVLVRHDTPAARTQREVREHLKGADLHEVKTWVKDAVCATPWRPG